MDFPKDQIAPGIDVLLTAAIDIKVLDDKGDLVLIVIPAALARAKDDQQVWHGRKEWPLLAGMLGVA